MCEIMCEKTIRDDGFLFSGVGILSGPLGSASGTLEDNKQYVSFRCSSESRRSGL